MKPNIGSVDKTIRVIAGLAILSLVFVLEGNVRWWGLLGLVPILTAFVGFCPAYTVFGLSTCKTK